MTSDPTVASIRPRPPEIRPLTTEPWTTAATSDSASSAVRKYSAGPNCSASSASAGAAMARKIIPMRPPAMAAVALSASAVPPCPRSHIG